MKILTGKILQEKGILSQSQLLNAEKLSEETGVSLEGAVKGLGFATSEDIAKCLADNFGFEFMDIDISAIKDINIGIVSEDVASRHNIVPIGRSGNVLTLASSSPLDILTLDNLRFVLGEDIKFVLITSESFKNIQELYQQKDKPEASILPSVDNILDTDLENADGIDIQLINETFDSAEDKETDAPIIKIVLHIISEAVKAQASDIHIEPMSDNLRIRYRIDGVCQQANVLPRDMQGAVISRIKIMSSIDITEKRKPQDGRISLKIEDQPLDLRVSTIPVTNGESIVMRLLESESIMVSLDQLGFEHDDLERYLEAIRRPNGILLITGPTGSGKTTTLYSSLNEINSPEKKLITVENPIEYDLRGVNQCEVNEAAGLTFPVILRSILRQDPNIVVVGEIRDIETAEIAIAAALTGHLILSTLHTNDAPSAITRLVDMGAKSYLVATSLLGVMAQRLVRMNCPECKEPFMYSSAKLAMVGINPDELKDVTFFKGKGCSNCKGTGYKGRIGIYELMIINNEIKDMIYNGETKEKIKKAAIMGCGMKTLRIDGLRKVFNGNTTIEEIIRVTG